MNESFFVVTSHGWSASHWLAISLDTHPEITCAHSALNIHSRGGDSSEGFLKQNVDKHGNAVRGRENLSIDTALDQVKSYTSDPKKHIFGNVHTYRIRDLPELKRKFPVPRKHVLMNLIRHPVSLVNSGFGQLRDFLEWDVYTLMDVVGAMSRQIDFASQLSKKYGLDLCEPNVLAFMGACYHQSFLARDHEIAPDAPTIIMERMTTDREYFSSVISYLSDGHVKCENDYLDEIFNIPQLNRHAKSKKMTPSEQYESWEPWQREAFKFSFEGFKLDKYYARYGYDFSFID